jgi:hypothetical protein
MMSNFGIRKFDFGIGFLAVNLICRINFGIKFLVLNSKLNIRNSKLLQHYIFERVGKQKLLQMRGF